MRLDGFGLFVEDMATMVRFYRDVLGFEIREDENATNVYLVKDGTLFMLYRRKDFEGMTHRRYEYLKGANGHFEIALYVDTYDEVDSEYARIIAAGGSVHPAANHGALGSAHLLHRRFGGQPDRDRLLQQALRPLSGHR